MRRHKIVAPIVEEGGDAPVVLLAATMIERPRGADQQAPPRLEHPPAPRQPSIRSAPRPATSLAVRAAGVALPRGRRRLIPRIRKCSAKPPVRRGLSLPINYFVHRTVEDGLSGPIQQFKAAPPPATGESGRAAIEGPAAVADPRPLFFNAGLS